MHHFVGRILEQENYFLQEFTLIFCKLLALNKPHIEPNLWRPIASQSHQHKSDINIMSLENRVKP